MSENKTRIMVKESGFSCVSCEGVSINMEDEWTIYTHGDSYIDWLGNIAFIAEVPGRNCVYCHKPLIISVPQIWLK